MSELTRRQGYTEFGSSDHLMQENELLRQTIKERDQALAKANDQNEILRLRLHEHENENAKLKDMHKAKRKFELVHSPPYGN